MPSNLNEDVDNGYDCLTAPVVSLTKGLCLKQLIDQHETEFEVKPSDDGEETEWTADESCFDFEDTAGTSKNDFCVADIEDGEDGTPFDRYRRKMMDIRSDGKLKKYVVKRGVGPLVPDTAVVYVRYQAYLEYAREPFDSTLHQAGGERDQPVAFNLAKGELIPGLHEAILTMQKGEKAEVLIDPDLAFGRFGCGTRIPPEATVLFLVEIDRFVDCGDAFENQDNMSMYERKAFCNAHKEAKVHYSLANDLFNSKNYSAAANKYRLAINMMHNARLADDNEEKIRNHFLIKNYTNACVCYKKLKMWKRICIMAADAVRVDEKEAFGNHKLLYFWGYAKMMLGDYVAAKDHLRRANKLQPQGVEISQALIELTRRQNDAFQEERLMMRRVFGTAPATVQIKEVDEVEEEFRNTVKEELKCFADDPERNEMLIKEQEFTTQEENIYKEEAKALGLYYRVADNAKRVIQIKKPADY